MSGSTHAQNKARAVREAIWERPEDPRHGTVNGYGNLRCRCDRCREAWRIAHTAWMNADPVRLARHAARERARRASRVEDW